MVDTHVLDQLGQRQRDEHGRRVPLEKGGNGKGHGQGEEGHPAPGQRGLALGEVDEQGAAAAQVEEKDVQPLEVDHGRRYQVVEKAAGQRRGHHDQQHGLHFPAHGRVPW
jgi:hypothetical protein